MNIMKQPAFMGYALSRSIL